MQCCDNLCRVSAQNSPPSPKSSKPVGQKVTRNDSKFLSSFPPALAFHLYAACWHRFHSTGTIFPPGGALEPVASRMPPTGGVPDLIHTAEEGWGALKVAPGRGEGSRPVTWAAAAAAGGDACQAAAHQVWTCCRAKEQTKMHLVCPSVCCTILRICQVRSCSISPAGGSSEDSSCARTI